MGGLVLIGVMVGGGVIGIRGLDVGASLGFLVSSIVPVCSGCVEPSEGL